MAPLITVMLLLLVLVTKTVFVMGFTATPMGSVPAATVVVLFVAPSITVTLLLPELAM